MFPKLTAIETGVVFDGGKPELALHEHLSLSCGTHPVNETPVTLSGQFSLQIQSPGRGQRIRQGTFPDLHEKGLPLKIIALADVNGPQLRHGLDQGKNGFSVKGTGPLDFTGIDNGNPVDQEDGRQAGVDFNQVRHFGTPLYPWLLPQIKGCPVMSF